MFKNEKYKNLGEILYKKKLAVLEENFHDALFCVVILAINDVFSFEFVRISTISDFRSISYIVIFSTQHIPRCFWCNRFQIFVFSRNCRNLSHLQWNGDFGLLQNLSGLQFQNDYQNISFIRILWHWGSNVEVLLFLQKYSTGASPPYPVRRHTRDTHF